MEVQRLMQMIASLQEEVKELREGLEFYTQEWVQVGTTKTGPVRGSRYNEETGWCEDVYLPDGVTLGIFEPPPRLAGQKHYKALKHLKHANRIRDERCSK